MFMSVYARMTMAYISSMCVLGFEQFSVPALFVVGLLYDVCEKGVRHLKKWIEKEGEETR